jgi:phosphoenolpyruvate phosphomutase
MQHKGMALRASLGQAGSLAYLMEAHNALSARIVEKHSFDGIWASGLGIASAYGARDANEVSCSEVVDVLERMSDMTDKPILADVDSGFGDFNNVRLLTRKLSGYGVAGICIEDKLYPKRNSFVGGNQQLAEIAEFCGKIRAAKDAQKDDGFMVVARTETFIAGGNIERALERATAYADAGADAILVHSKLDNAGQVIEFGEAWDRPVPLVAIPTTYPAVDVHELYDRGYRAVIWANHSLRASVRAIDVICARIADRRSIANLEGTITSLPELFALLNYDELELAEARYGKSGHM